MNENIIENKKEQMTEEKDFSIGLCDDLTNGLHSVLYKRINNVEINDVRIQNAFMNFTKNVECGASFSIAEMLLAAEQLNTGCKIDINAGNGIYIIEDFNNANKKVLKTLLSLSVEGIYLLFALRNGIAFDIDLIGGSMMSGETKRFLVASPKKIKKLEASFKNNNVKFTKVGEMLSEDKIVVTRGNEIVETVSKNFINSDCEKVSLHLSPNEFQSFISGYNSVLSVALCDNVSQNNVVRFGLDGSFETLFARALGFFSALIYEKNVRVRRLFSTEQNCTVAVSRPNVSDGDYLYLLRVRNDIFDMPDKIHFSQLKYYLSEKKRNGVIKDILSVRDDIERIYYRLCNDSLEFVPITENVEYGFGVIVSVGRGESVNGIKIGYFKNKDTASNINDGVQV